MDEETFILPVAISEIVGHDYTDFMQWVYNRFEKIIEKTCDKCKRTCHYVSIEEYVGCVIGPVNYADLYQEFKQSKKVISSQMSIK